jgi:uncharacterized protein (TIGR00730 family)
MGAAQRRHGHGLNRGILQFMSHSLHHPSSHESSFDSRDQGMSKPLKKVAVFCGSNFGASSIYAEAAKSLGATLGERGIGLVYGGTHMGLMGVLADAALSAGADVTGIINQRLHDQGHLHPKLSRHEIVPDMRTRKARMGELADAFIALPGGLGTFEELFEAATLTQLRDHPGSTAKACGALNVNGFFDPLRGLLDRAVQEGFMKSEHNAMIVMSPYPQDLLDALSTWQAPVVNKWIQTPEGEKK